MMNRLNFSILIQFMLVMTIRGQIFYDGFETNDFSQWTTSSGGASVVGSPTYNGTHAAKFQSTSMLKKSSLNESGTITWDLYVIASQTNRTSPTFRGIDNGGHFGPYVYLTNSGQFRAMNGAVGTQISTYAAGIWYHITMVIYLASKTYDVWIDQTKVATSFSFQDTNWSGNLVELELSSNTLGSWNLDEITLSSGVHDPLPVELLSFQCRQTSTRIELTWNTASEVNNSGFVVLRSGTDGVLKEISPLISGHGNSTTTNSYSFLDNNLPGAGVYQYVLRDIDFEGSTTDHGPITVNYQNVIKQGASVVPQRVSLSSFPNPFNPSTNIVWQISAVEGQAEASVRLEIFDQFGALVRTLVSGSVLPGRYENVWNGLDNRGTQVASGAYTVRLFSNANLKASQRITLMK